MSGLGLAALAILALVAGPVVALVRGGALARIAAGAGIAFVVLAVATFQGFECDRADCGEGSPLLEALQAAAGVVALAAGATWLAVRAWGAVRRRPGSA